MQVLLFVCIQDTGQGGLPHRAVIRPCFDEGVMHQQCAVMAIILTKHARKASAWDNVQLSESATFSIVDVLCW